MPTFDAMILAAGEGSRLAPLTRVLAKPLVPLLGRTLLDRAIARAGDWLPRQIVVNTFYHGAAVAQAVQRTKGVSAPLVVSAENTVLGPLGGVRQALPLFVSDWLLLQNADAYLPALPPAFEEALKNPPAPVVFLTTTQENLCPQSLGIAPTGQVVSVRGAGPRAGEAVAQRGFLGVSLWHLPTFKTLLPALSPFTPLDLAPHVLPELFARGIPVQTLDHEGYFCDVGTPRRLLDLHHQLLAGELAEMPPYPATAAGIFCSPLARVHPRATLLPPVFMEDHVVVGAGAVVGPFVSLHQNSVVQEGVRLSNSMVFEGAVVGAESVLNQVLVSPGATTPPKGNFQDAALLF